MPTPRRYRWVALALAMLVNIPVQVLWISYSAITPQAARAYGVDDFWVVVLGLLFMVVYVPASLPASWLVDRFGVHRAVGLGALLVGVGGVARGLSGGSYVGAFTATVVIALGQPLLMNAWAALPADWFPADEQAGAVGLTTVASLLGAGLGTVLPPVLGGWSTAAMQLLFGAVALAVALVFVACYRDSGAPAAPREDTRALMSGVRQALSMPALRLYLLCCTLGMGVFNGLTMLTAEIVAPLGLGAEEASCVGAALLVGGVAGAGVLPHLSDRAGRRVPYLAVGLALGGVALLAMAAAHGAIALYVISAVLGAALVPLLPIGMAYAVDLAHPVPEGTTNGIIQIASQASAVYVGVLWVLRTGSGSFWPGLALSGILLVLAGAAMTRLPEPAPAPTPSPAPAAH